MERGKIDYIIDVGLALAFLCSAVTGIMKFPGLLRQFGITFLPTYQFSRIHDWSGIFLATLVLVHLIRHWRWIVGMTKRMFGKKS